MELAMFIHFNINTYHNKQWSDGTLDPKTFNPTDLDCEQWVQVAQTIGAKYIVLTVKHHDGFCLWPTKTTGYSVASSSYKDGKGDVLQEFLDACRKHGMGVGLYLSPWDRNCPVYDDQDKYTDIYEEQLRELVEDYCDQDEIVEFWFDGANSYKDKFDWDRIYGILRKHQPNCSAFNMGYMDIRWVGNEWGRGQYPNYHVIKFNEWPKYELGKGSSNGEGDYWTNVEINYPIRPLQWFHQEKPFQTRLFSVKKLVKRYYNSVGQGANMLLNLGPDKSGKIPRKDALQAKKLGDQIRTLFSEKTFIAETTGEGDEVILEFPPQIIDTVVIQENLMEGQRVDSYMLFYWQKDGWVPLKSKKKFLTIGHKKIDPLVKPVTTGKIKWKVKEAISSPIIRRLAVYHTNK